MRQNPHNTVRHLRQLAARTPSSNERDVALQRAVELERKYHLTARSTFEAIYNVAVRRGYVDDSRVLRGIHFLHRTGRSTFCLELSEFSGEWRLLRGHDELQTIATGYNAQDLDTRLSALA